MVKVIIDGKVVELKKGQNFMDVEIESGIPFACRAGVCQTCAITVTTGEEHLSELNDNEEMMGAEGSHRLSCQCVSKTDDKDAKVEAEIGWV